ncbi:Protein of unknown function [Burkholderia cepacia]|uniref:DUF3268 family zinc-finger domain-containing protein n=1 Tax=Burkholderia cepacia TaxID=292 RepID=UPI0008D33A49|nr:DUF3268 family zinc-finger domain-containing protein [Burkholderia cepacia]SEU36388.1 Protein of unknown function [Burkholderia cepacia]
MDAPIAAPPRAFHASDCAAHSGGSHSARFFYLIMQTTKTPWNPSRRATARVKNPLPAPTKCPYDGGPVEIVNNSAIYGRKYGEWPWAFLCRSCRAYVGLHPFTKIPLGTLADGPTRDARKRAKAAFNPIWESGRMTRTDAYIWLARRLGIANHEECHIGWFDVATCDRVVAVIQQEYSL